ncbi:MAG: glycosyltransferase [Rhodoferax sp.]
MRVLFVSTHPHWPELVGGLQSTTHETCLAFLKLGVEVGVLCVQRNPPELEPPAPPVVRDIHLGYPVLRCRTLRADALSLIAGFDPDVLVLQSGPQLVPLLGMCQRSGLPLCVYLHNVELAHLGGSLWPDPELLYLANSDFCARRWRDLAGLDCAVITPLIDDARCLVEGQGDHVLFVNPVPIKGVERALALAGACPEIPFLIQESWQMEAGARARYRQRAASLPNLTWCEPTLDMASVYAKSRVLLMPSVWEEAFGRTAVEAQVNGIPVLASTRGGLPQSVGSGGLLLPLDAEWTLWVDALHRLYWPGPVRDEKVVAAIANANALATPSLTAARLLGLLLAHVQRWQ